MKAKALNFLYAFCLIAPWAQLALLFGWVTSGVGGTLGAYQDVLDKYNAAYTNDKLAQVLIQHLGASIQRDSDFMRLTIIILIAALPLNFFACRLTRKLIIERDSKK